MQRALCLGISTSVQCICHDNKTKKTVCRESTGSSVARYISEQIPLRSQTAVIADWFFLTSASQRRDVSAF